MSLTVGSTLQNGKYLIQETLYQSDFSITYQAVHTVLAQSVIIQTLNDSLRLHAQFERLRQKFLAEVRRYSYGESDAIAKVRDYFEEDGKPFVVLERSPDQTPAQLSAWLNFLDQEALNDSPSEASSLNLQSESNPSQAAAIASSVELQPSVLPLAQPQAAETVTPQFSSSTSPCVTRPPDPALDGHEDELAQPNQEASIPATVPVAAPATVAVAAATPASAATQPVLPNPPSQSVPPLKSQPPAQPPRQRSVRRMIPLALAMTAIGSGLAGAGFGWNLRFQESGEAAPPSLFSREQSFPPQDDWLGEDPYADLYDEPYDDAENFAPDGEVLEQRDTREYRPEHQRERVEYRPRIRRRISEPEPAAVPELDEPLPEDKAIPVPDAIDIDPVPPAEAAPVIPDPVVEPEPVAEPEYKAAPLPELADPAPPVVSDPAPMSDPSAIAQ